MSLERHFSKTFSEAVLYGNDIFDDSTNDIPIAGLTTPRGLRDRFLHRLSMLTMANIRMSEDEKNHSVTIVVICDHASSYHENELLQFLRSMTKSLIFIAVNEAGHCGKECEDLWDTVLIYAYDHVDHLVKSLCRSFDDNKHSMADLVTKTTRINCIDGQDATIDDELADLLVSFYHHTIGYTGAMRELHILLEAAAAMCQTVGHLENRLNYLFDKNRFARKLYQLIYTLGIPKRSCDTFIRAAQTSGLFEKVTFDLQRRSTLSTRPLSTPSTATQSNFSKLPKSPFSLSQQAGKTQNLSSKDASLSSPSTLPKLDCGWFEAAKLYLSAEDQAMGLFRLEETKRDVAQLVGTVLNGNILPVQANAWYAFGFVATNNEDEERRLAGLYAVLLKESDNRSTIFRELMKGVQMDELVNLFDIKGYSHFRGLFTHLEAFLKQTPEERWTVWRLKQYIQTDETVEPPACLQRDYGFKFCRQREEAERLKDIYRTMLSKLDVQELHHACVYGRLFEIGARKGIVQPQNKRLMQNDHPSPYVGYDNDKGLNAYRGRFWEKHLKL